MGKGRPWFRSANCASEVADAWTDLTLTWWSAFISHSRSIEEGISVLSVELEKCSLKNNLQPCFEIQILMSKANIGGKDIVVEKLELIKKLKNSAGEKLYCFIHDH